MELPDVAMVEEEMARRGADGARRSGSATVGRAVALRAPAAPDPRTSSSVRAGGSEEQGSWRRGLHVDLPLQSVVDSGAATLSGYGRGGGRGGWSGRRALRHVANGGRPAPCWELRKRYHWLFYRPFSTTPLRHRKR